jgi:hypothetical protein
MKVKNIFKKLQIVLVSLVAINLISCGGGGGGGNLVLWYPFENIYGDLCVGEYDPVPGCTFNSDDGSRVNASQSSDYDIFGNSADDLYRVEFNGSGWANVYEIIGGVFYFVESRHVSSFSGWQGSTFVGVGTTGLFWEDVSFGDYFLDSNGVLYSANVAELNFFEAINNQTAGMGVNTDIVSINEDINKKLVDKAAQKLASKYGFEEGKAQAVASQLNRFAVGINNRGYSTPEDIKSSFQATFGVDYGSAVAAVKDLMGGSPEAMVDLQNRSANALGIKPRDAKRFIQDSYEKALADFGYTGSLNW